MMSGTLVALLAAAALLLTPGGAAECGGQPTAEQSLAAPPAVAWVLPSRLPDVGAGGMAGEERPAGGPLRAVVEGAGDTASRSRR